MTTPPRDVPPYHALAAGYDVVMEHVDYAAWAEYVLDLLAEHMPETESILEFGCGTGSLALEIQERAHEIAGPGGGFDYLATDAVAEMIRIARAKAGVVGFVPESGSGQGAGSLGFEVADFLTFQPPSPVDVVLLLYDGMNYLLEESAVAALLENIARCLRPGGVAIVDQSTPANSVNNADYFGDEGEVGDFHYVRRSSYEEGTRLHVTEFELVVEDETFTERHLQRAYAIDQVSRLIDESPMALEGAFDGFTFQPADHRTERIHWVLRKPLAG